MALHYNRRERPFCWYVIRGRSVASNGLTANLPSDRAPIKDRASRTSLQERNATIHACLLVDRFVSHIETARPKRIQLLVFGKATYPTLCGKQIQDSLKTRSNLKMLGPFATASRRTPIHQVSLSHAACASMSTTKTPTTTTTTRDRGDRYGPIEWAQ